MTGPAGLPTNRRAGEQEQPDGTPSPGPGQHRPSPSLSSPQAPCPGRYGPMYGLSDEDDGSPPVPSVPPPIGSKSEPVRTGPGPALRGVWLPSVVLLVARTAAEDRVLGDLWYWTVPGRDGKVRAKIRLDDAHWVWRTLPWSAERLGLSRGQLRRAQLTLVDKGYVAKARGRRGRTLWRALPDRIREEAHRRLQARGIIPSAGEAAMAPEWKSRLRGVYVPDW